MCAGTFDEVLGGVAGNGGAQQWALSCLFGVASVEIQCQWHLFSLWTIVVEKQHCRVVFGVGNVEIASLRFGMGRGGASKHWCGAVWLCFFDSELDLVRESQRARFGRLSFCNCENWHGS